MDSVTNMVARKPLVIFSKSNCCISHSIKSLMYGFGANPTIYELDELPNGRKLEKELQTLLGRRPSVPVVFVAENLIGGSNEVMSLHLQGKLVKKLIEAGAIFL